MCHGVNKIPTVLGLHHFWKTWSYKARFQVLTFLSQIYVHLLQNPRINLHILNLYLFSTKICGRTLGWFKRGIFISDPTVFQTTFLFESSKINFSQDLTVPAGTLRHRRSLGPSTVIKKHCNAAQAKNRHFSSHGKAIKMLRPLPVPSNLERTVWM